MFRILSIIAIWQFTPIQSNTFPVFGTKRYHRATNVGGVLPQQTSTSLIGSNLIVPYYNPMSSSSQYYDEQPIYAIPPNYQYTSSGGLGGHRNTNDDDDDNDTAYYYPSSGSVSSSSSAVYQNPSRHEYHAYGMPTYHGEYKPSPYYYAPGPSYSYYDDSREILNNPLDDLHEEMLQEDERERQREIFPVIGQENWYGNSRKQDVYTRNFLKNLIAYNRQMEAQQQQQLLLQQQQQQQQMQRDQENEYDDYMDMNPSEYEYDQINENPYDLLNRFEKQQLPIRENMKNDNDGDVEDENVRQLKLLANSKQQQQEKQKTKNNNNNNNVKNADSDKNLNNRNINRHENNYHQRNYGNWQQPSAASAPSLSSQSTKSFNQYEPQRQPEPKPEPEPEYEEEDEEDWINWDKKRSDNQMRITFMNDDESIRAFTNRKPSSVVEHYQKSATKKPAPSLSSSQQTTSSSSSSTTTTTSKPTSNRKFSGQKEVVLPRPATPAQHLFPQPVLDMIDKGIVLAQKQQQQQQTNRVVEARTNTDSTAAAAIATETKRSKDSSMKSNANIYDTIKELIAMEEQLEKNPLESKVQKRFVSNEESLVHELDSLKRRSL